MEAQRMTWPSEVRNMPWPKTGITYSYENRGYIQPAKLQRWLDKAFGGRERAEYRMLHGRIYIKAPREPTKAEYDWMQDDDKRSGVQVAECGWLTL